MGTDASARPRRTSVPPPLTALDEVALVAGWDAAADTQPVVTVCCIAYNHVETVADAIEGILAQRTSFPFEVLVQDDASSDGTAEVVARYAASHPHVVRAILCEENLYSKNGKTLGNVLPLARGELIAVCEADDYWCDPDKLQRQVEALRRTGAQLSLHPAVEVDTRTGAARRAGRLAREDALLPPGATLSVRTPPYAAALYERAALDRYERFRDREAPPLGDVFMMAIGSLAGGVAYVDRTMSVYRRHLAGSWTAQHIADHATAAQHSVRMIIALDALAEDAPELAAAIRVRRLRIWRNLVWTLQKAIAARQLSRRQALRTWPHGHFAPVHVALGRIAVIVLPTALTSAAKRRMKSSARRHQARRDGHSDGPAGRTPQDGARQS